MHIAIPELTASDVARFWSKVQKSPSCWLWTASIRGENGYGRFTLCRSGRYFSVASHRLSWVIARGSIPDGKLVLHACDNPLCVNPDHLFIGTTKDNQADCVAKGRTAKGGKNAMRLYPDKVLRGEKNGHSRLKPDEIPVIRNLYKSGLTYHQVADRYEVSWMTIWMVVKRKTWRHIA